MKTLPLFPTGLPPQALDLAGPLRRNPQCSRCQLGERTTNRCLPPAGEAGGLLTVGSHPSNLENLTGQVIADGPRGANLLRSVRKHWPGPVASAYAVGCYPGPDGEDRAEPKHAASCRPYLRSYAEQVAPTRILLLGELACWGVLGRAVSTRSVRRGFAWVRLPHGRVPALILMNPVQLDGRHARAAWETDLEWALTTPDSFFAERLAFLEAGTYSMVSTVGEAEAAAAELQAGGLEEIEVNGRRQIKGIAWDVETRGQLHNSDFVIISASLCVRGSNKAFVWDRPSCENERVRAPLVSLLKDPSLLFVEQGSYDERASLCYFKTSIKGARRDVRLLRKHLDCAVQKANLDTLSELVGMGGYKDEFSSDLDAVKKQVRAWKPKQQFLFDDCPDPYARQKLRDIYDTKDQKVIDDCEDSYRYALVPRHKLSIYNPRDTVATGLLDELLWPQIEESPGLSMVWGEVTGPASRSFTWSEHWGAWLSRPEIDGLISYGRHNKKLLEPQLRAHLTEEFKDLELGSRDKVARFLYSPKEIGGLGMPITKRTKGGKEAVDQEAIDALRGRHPFIDIYAAYSSLDNDVEKGHEFLRFLREDGAVHPSYLLDGTETGRMSCIAPNLGNLKRPEDCILCKGKSCAECAYTGTDADSRRIRSCIGAPDEYEVLDVDLNQIELRFIAASSGDPVMTQAYVEGKDIHAYIAEMATKIAGFIISRQQAKPIDFGMAFGLTPGGLSRQLRIPMDVAIRIFEAVMSVLKGAQAHKQQILRHVQRNGWTYNTWRGLIAQHRPLWDIDSQDKYKRNKAGNAGYNCLVQGSGSGYPVISSHARVVEYVLNNNLDHLWRPEFTVYDSIVAITHRSITPLAARLTVDIMTDLNIGYLKDGSRFPVVADCKVGCNLGAVKKYKPPATLAEAISESKKLGFLEARRDPRRGRMGLLTA